MIEQLLRHFSCAGTKCAIRTNGKDIVGHFICEEDTLLFKDSSGKKIPLSEKAINDIEAISMVMPAKHTKITKEISVEPNGVIVKCNQYRGQVRPIGSNVTINLDFEVESILDDNLYELIKTGDPSLANGEKVFCGKSRISKDKTFYTPFILLPSTLNEMMDKVADYAKEGCLVDAIDITEALRDYFPNNKEIKNFYDVLCAEYDSYEKKCKVDFYSPYVDEKEGKNVVARGRILTYENGRGTIVDIDSHQELVFSKSNLMIEKDYEDDYIGLPVTYVVIKNSLSRYEARSIIEPGDIEDILQYAWSIQQDLTAWGIGQIVYRQYPDCQEALNLIQKKEGIPYVSQKKWNIENLSRYDGEYEQKIVDVNYEMPSVLLNREVNYTEDIEEIIESSEDVTTNWNIPRDEPVEFVSTKEDSGSAEGALDSVEPASEIAKENHTGTPLINLSKDSKDTTKKSIFKGKTISNSFEDLSLENIIVDENTEDSNLPCLTYTSIVRERRGNICYIDAGTGNPKDDITFTINDIVDEDLKEQATNDFRRDRFLKGEKIVCQIEKKRAYAVTKPMNIIKAIGLAKNMGEMSYSRLDAHDVEESQNLKKKAIGILESILDQFPDNYDAQNLKYKISKGIRELEPSPYDEDLYGRDDIISTNMVDFDDNEGNENKMPRNGIIKIISEKDEEGLDVPGLIYDDLSYNTITYLSHAIVDVDFVEEVSTPVVYSIKEHNGKPVAWCIHRQKTVEEMIRFTDELYRKRHMPVEAWGVIVQLLERYPDNEEARAILDRYECDPMIKDNKPKILTLLPKDDEGNDLQRAGMDCYLSKDYEQAISLFEKATKQYDVIIKSSYDTERETNTMHFDALKKKDECIRNISLCYRGWCKRCEEDLKPEIEAKYEDFGKNSLIHLRKNFQENLSCIEQYYTYFNDEAGYLLVLEDYVKLFQHSRSIKSKRSLAEIFAKIAKFYLDKNTKEANREARRYQKRAVKIDPDSSCVIAKKIYAVLNYRDVKNGEYCAQYIDEINIPQAFSSLRYADGILESDIAEAYVKKETAYYLALTNLSKAKKSNYLFCLKKCLSAYLTGTMGIEPDEIEGKTHVDFQIAQCIHECMKRRVTWSKWRNIIEICIVDDLSAKLIMNMLYDLHPTYCAQLLERFNRELPRAHKKSDFIHEFNSLLQYTAQHYRQWSDMIYNMEKTNDIHEIKEFFTHSFIDDGSWMLEDDKFLIRNINKRLPNCLKRYVKATSSRDTNLAYSESIEFINNCVREVKVKPTLLSINAIDPLLLKVKEILENDYQQHKLKAPLPQIDILTVSSVNEHSKINIQIEIKNNEVWSMPIYRHNIQVEYIDGKIESANKTFHAPMVYGTESHIFVIQLSSINGNRVIGHSMNVVLTYQYTYGNELSEKISKEISIKIPEFSRHVSPYAAFGTKCEDEDMFYGRQKFIDKVTDEIGIDIYGQYLVYGQKRCGKSSLIYHLKKNIEKSNVDGAIPNVICAMSSYLDVSNTDQAYYKILYSIQESLNDLKKIAKKRYRREISEAKKNGVSTEGIIQMAVPEFNLPEENEYYSLKEPEDSKFESFIKEFRSSLTSMEGWEHCRLIVIIDEFTSIHKAIKDKLVKPQFMFTWKRLQEQESTRFASILVGQDVTATLQHDYSNVYAIIHDYRLTYLADSDALSLIRDPLEKKGIRFVGDAAKLVLRYTAGNPYYIWIFCHNLVNQINENSSNDITKYDVEKTADYLAKELDSKYFDNLVLAGEDNKVSEFSKEDNEPILKSIALEQEKHGSCSRSFVINDEFNMTDSSIDLILQNLEDREVIRKEGNHYDIIVKLYSKWLCAQNKKIY